MSSTLSGFFSAFNLALSLFLFCYLIKPYLPLLFSNFFLCLSTFEVKSEIWFDIKEEHPKDLFKHVQIAIKKTSEGEEGERSVATKKNSEKLLKEERGEEGCYKK